MTKEIFVLAAGYFNSRTGRYERYQEIIALYREIGHFGTIFTDIELMLITRVVQIIKLLDIRLKIYVMILWILRYLNYHIFIIITLYLFKLSQRSFYKHFTEQR